MKKIYLLSLFVGLLAFVACSDDNDDNPTYHQPTSFVLNVPPYAAVPVVLEESESLNLTCSQPDYGFTAATTYAVQVALTDTWTEATETIEASYVELYTTFTTAAMSAVSEEVAKAVVQLAGWGSPEEAVTDPMDLHIRLRARTVSGQMPSVYSNSVKISVMPYYIELKAADPAFYFLIGNSVGDKSWSANWDAIGTATIPMGVVKDYEYDQVTGAGKFRYTGYFDAATQDNGFKLIGMINGAINWDEQWGNGEDGDMPGIGNLVHLHNEGGNPGHLGLPDAGWWQIDVDGTGSGELLFTKLSGEPHAAYSSMEIMGSFNDWATPVYMSQIGNATHCWMLKHTFDADCELKFRAEDNWDISWGGTQFPYGVSSSSDNMNVKAGTYIIVFNDIDKSYGFFEQ